MRFVIADCQVDYSGRLDAHLPRAKRALMLKADGSVLVHSDGGSYKPLNWMSPPARMEVQSPEAPGAQAIWRVKAEKSDDQLVITVFEVLEDLECELGIDPGLTKDGVESHLQQLLADNPSVFGAGFKTVRREHQTPIGPVDLMLQDAEGHPVIVEVKRVGGIDGVEQLTRYYEMLSRDKLLPGLQAIFAAQVIKPQARVLAEDRGFRCVVLDYNALRGLEGPQGTLF